MMAEHGKPCIESEATFCMNGGTCFRIPSVSTPTCVCRLNYEGSRCEQYQLVGFSHSREQRGLIAATVIILIIILTVLCLLTYYICKMKRKNQRQRKPAEEGLRTDVSV